jgi:hypothetical protein
MANVLTVHVPTRTVSERNERCHWAVRNKRKKEQQKAVFFAWRKAVFGKRIPMLPCVVRLTRFGPRLLDGDNLQSSLKFCRDEVAKLLNVDDGDARIQFEYDQQVTPEYSVMIKVEKV